jgi:alpha-glucuronidase
LRWPRDLGPAAHAEGAYAPWLRYRAVAAARAAACRAFASQVFASAATPAQSAARAELQRDGLLGATPTTRHIYCTDGY